MKKTTAAIAGAALIVAGIAGFGVAQAATAPGAPSSSSTSSVDPTIDVRDRSGVSAPDSTPSPAAAVDAAAEDGIAPADLTLAGAICDMRSLYTHECDIQYPKTGFLNGVHRAARDAEAVTDAEWLSYGAKSCEGYSAGGNVQTIHTVPDAMNAATDIASNDQVVNSAAQNILCPEFATR